VDAILTQSMRHSSPESKRDYLLGMHEEVREAMDEANREFFGDDGYHIFSTVAEKHKLEVEEERLQIVETKDEQLVDLRGFEPLTPWLQTRCSPN
jgi:hypothetical protein